MVAKTTHFRVGNGDMMLIELESGRRILTDINIRTAADDPDDETPNVAGQLRARLTRDDQDRLYVDAFLLTHPDADHIRGLKKHFHLGPIEDWSESADKIIIREMWSSPIVFRRASSQHSLCDDAKAWNTEARRRVQKYRDSGELVSDGDRILILGEDVDGKTDDLGSILVKVEETFSKICGWYDSSFEGRLLAPLHAEDDEEETIIIKNNSSVVLRLDLIGEGQRARYLVGGDAEVAIWDRIWDRHQDYKSRLEYDILVAPHHCSWHSLSYDSWSQMGEDAQVSQKARNALGQARSGAIIISSSVEILDDENDPPCIRAKREYEDILSPVNGRFRCLGDGEISEPMVIEIKLQGPTVKRASVAASVAVGTGIGSQPFQHG
jgi:beta-lactamase superfamily II metal-dependent hydrolase